MGRDQPRARAALLRSTQKGSAWLFGTACTLWVQSARRKPSARGHGQIKKLSPCSVLAFVQFCTMIHACKSKACSPLREKLTPPAERETTGGERCGLAPASRLWGCDLFLHQEDAQLSSALLSSAQSCCSAGSSRQHRAAPAEPSRGEKPQRDRPWLIQRPSSSIRTLPRICFPLKITSELGSWVSTGCACLHRRARGHEQLRHGLSFVLNYTMQPCRNTVWVLTRNSSHRSAAAL